MYMFGLQSPMLLFKMQMKYFKQPHKCQELTMVGQINIFVKWIYLNLLVSKPNTRCLTFCQKCLSPCPVCCGPPPSVCWPPEGPPHWTPLGVTPPGLTWCLENICKSSLSHHRRRWCQHRRGSTEKSYRHYFSSTEEWKPENGEHLTKTWTLLHKINFNWDSLSLALFVTEVWLWILAEVQITTIESPVVPEQGRACPANFPAVTEPEYALPAPINRDWEEDNNQTYFRW